MRAVFPVNLFLLAMVTGCAATSSGPSSATGSNPAPAFALTAANGAKLSLADQKGKVVVLDFWATWCPPCRESLPHIQKLGSDPELAQKGMVVWAVNARENDRAIQAFLDQAHYTFTVLKDSDGAVANSYSVSSLPTTIVIGRDGSIRKVIVGHDSQTAQQLDEAIHQALAESGGSPP